MRGEDFLIKSKRKDEQKKLRCNKKKIKLIIFDVSKQKNKDFNTDYQKIKQIILLNKESQSFTIDFQQEAGTEFESVISG